MIAYQVLGEGPFNVVFIPGSVSHVEVYWEAAGVAALLRGVAAYARVLVFDKRGTGMSDRVAQVPTLEERSDDIRAVMDAAGSERAALFGASEGVPMSVVFAASHPERVSALVLYGGMARTMWAPDYLFGYTEREWRRESGESIEDFVTPGGVEAMVRSGFPSAEEEEVRAWARVFRYGGSPGTFEALDRMNAEIDVRHVLGVISTPTLVLHQHADPWVRVEHGRYLARHIPGAAYVELDGKEHIPTAAFTPQLLTHMIPFLQEAAAREAPEPDKVLATVLFSDIEMLSRVTEPLAEMSPLPERVTVSRDALTPVTVMSPLPLRSSTASDGTLTFTYMGLLALKLPTSPMNSVPAMTWVVTWLSRFESAWTTTDCRAPATTVTLSLPARSMPLKSGSARVDVAATPEPCTPDDLDEPGRTSRASSTTPMTARMRSAVKAAIWALVLCGVC